MTAIHIDADTVLGVLDEHGWTRGVYQDADSGAVCLHGAIRRCSPVPGDAHIVEQVATRQGWGTDWNDAPGTTEADVRARLSIGIDITDADLETTFGPQWRAVVAVIRRAATLTPDEATRLAAARAAARDAARAAARAAAWDAAWDAARVAAGAAAWDAAWDAAGVAAWAAARDAAGGAARDAAGGAARAVVTWDLATDDGPYTPAHRDLLTAPWVSVCGPLTDLIEATP